MNDTLTEAVVDALLNAVNEGDLEAVEVYSKAHQRLIECSVSILNVLNQGEKHND